MEIEDENEGDAENNEGDEAVGALLTPGVEEDDFGNADEQKTKAGEAEAALADDERKQEYGDRFDSPADGDAAGRDFVEDQESDENHGEEEIDLFWALQGSGQRVIRIVG